MDHRRLAALTRSCAERPPRRRLLAALVALPALGGLAALTGVSATEARRRRKHRGDHHRRRRCKCCRADVDTVTCEGQCGIVLNNCRQPVDCGPCA